MAVNHPIHIHPARPLYRFTATALGAIDVSGQKGRACIARLEAPVGSLSDSGLHQRISQNYTLGILMNLYS
ncbi:hypothetical protein BDW75DRAFT_140705 [Aspergillus navahoensis]